MQQVYLDAASAAPLHPAAEQVLAAASSRGYADPRRLHRAGREARLLVDNAREVVAESLGVHRDEVLFTPSGTMAVHSGLLGLVRASGARSVALAPVEHRSVRDVAEWAGVDSIELPVDDVGRIGPVPRVLEPQTVIAVQQANHEIGTLQPVDQIASAAGGIPLFVDAGASMGRLPLPDHWSAVAGSAHKWGGPTGVGILVVRKDAPWVWPWPGDRFARHEQDFTNVPGALAAAAALQAVVAERGEVNARQFDLINRIRAEVSRIADADLVGDPVDRLPHLVTFSFLYLDGEALVTELDRRGFAVSSGSACAAEAGEPSRVLAAIGALTHGNVRVSLDRSTTAEEIDRFLGVLPDVVADLRAQVDL